ncbi:MAG TPA: helix-turn-helix domain-containing protein, partial [Nocardioides sp.]|nr:helix-turn-helix domain-containing protein [Nocardioides sp.]
MTPLPGEQYGDNLRLASPFPDRVSTSSTTEEFHVRADARRNYDRIVEVAREVFREQGYDASLDEVAKRAGVGPGT